MATRAKSAFRRYAAYRRGFEDARSRCADLATSVGRDDLGAVMRQLQANAEGYVLSDYVVATLEGLIDVARAHDPANPVLIHAETILHGDYRRALADA